ncbi:succinate dehydrogenase assembly factor 2 [Sulfitobacter sp. S190]|uniref:succinate dehydrogenase assembly factor 2 n=1 Tax=Sulfitobacter sp. S190 TaxID=2867022 RepID=UPI0021A5D109|nr:succinate dehydrogenase assembly factor 2 [Sulfitobacter sp. S190]UWR21484.1 succinate dehydrogenase assembly factor 2 [Sulfitobacter sp. S190]
MIELPHPTPPADETRETREKRLVMRSMRRGIKEMDLILSAYARDRLAAMTVQDLDLYDRLLNENDHDLYQWVTGQVPAKDPYGAMVSDIQSHVAGIHG